MDFPILLRRRHRRRQPQPYATCPEDWALLEDASLLLIHQIFSELDDTPRCHGTRRRSGTLVRGG